MEELAYKTMKANFRTFMNDIIKGETYNTFYEAAGVRSIRDVPQSRFNGAYLITWGGTEKADRFVTAGQIDVIFNMSIHLSFFFNRSQSDYLHETSAVNDVEMIIKKRVNPNSWENTTCQWVNFVSASPFEYLNTDYATTEIKFKVRYIIQ